MADDLTLDLYYLIPDYMWAAASVVVDEVPQILGRLCPLLTCELLPWK